MSFHRLETCAVLAAGFLVTGARAQAREVRIVAADGRLAPEGRVQRVVVQAGQVVSLAADEVAVAPDGRIEYAHRPPEDFAWQADDPPDRCDPAVGCTPDSRFEATPSGVNYYVPWDPPARIRIRASLKGGPASEVVDLVRDDGEFGRPAWEHELDGLGYWVVVAGNRVFVPVVYVADWAPYRHGYWYWTAYGWTWYSFDPWGAITDHCGHWRHHRAYGWVWVPDPVCVWRPAIVTFFFGPMWIGWYPYDPGWTYWYGYEHGYDDGYWLGYAVGQAAGEGHAHPGFVATTYEDFCPDDHGRHDPGKGKTGHEPDRPEATSSRPVRDLSRVRLADPVAANEAFNEAVRKGHVGPVPGGGSDPADGWKFWAQRTGVRPTEVPLKTTTLHAGIGRWLEPVNPPAEVPDEYREAVSRIRSSTDALAGQKGQQRVKIGQTLDAAGARSMSPVRGGASPPATGPSGTPEWTESSGPGRATSTVESSPAGPIRIPPRQNAPREYRVVPARPPIEPARTTPEWPRPTTRPARPSALAPVQPFPGGVVPVRTSFSRERVDERSSDLLDQKQRGEHSTPANDNHPTVKPTFVVPPRPVSRPTDRGSVQPARRIVPLLQGVSP